MFMGHDVDRGKKNPGISFDVDHRVFGYTMLLFGQQLFIQRFNPEANNEWKDIQPIIKELHQGLNEKNKQKGYEKALRWRTDYHDILQLYDFNDLWYIMYCISNYRINWINLHPEQDREEIKLLRYALINVAKKSHKRYSEFKSRHI